MVIGETKPRRFTTSGMVLLCPTTSTLPLLDFTRLLNSATLSAGTVVTLRPSALASGAAVCCVRLNSVAKTAVIFASFNAVASDAARARPASDRSGSVPMVGALPPPSLRSAWRTRNTVCCADSWAPLTTVKRTANAAAFDTADIFNIPSISTMAIHRLHVYLRRSTLCDYPRAAGCDREQYRPNDQRDRPRD